MICYDSRVILVVQIYKDFNIHRQGTSPDFFLRLFPDIKYLNAPPYLQQEHTVSRHQAEARSTPHPSHSSTLSHHSDFAYSAERKAVFLQRKMQLPIVLFPIHARSLNDQVRKSKGLRT